MGSRTRWGAREEARAAARDKKRATARLRSRLGRVVIGVLFTTSAWADWPRVLEAAGLDAADAVHVEGASAEAARYGFRAGTEQVTVRSVSDTFQPKLQIVWEEAQRVARFDVPARATVFTRERWSGAPLAAGFRDGAKVVFWTATPLGNRGYERYPYVPQALVELGLKPRAESRALWAFFDSSYRLRADPDYLAARWRRGGLGALHIAAWHYWEPDRARDAWLEKLIAACHRHAILTYAWVELPHVSEAFWRDHPQWRERTATGQDAQLDWRRLMNLTDPHCAAAVARGLEHLMARFDWDGLNLGELYFESLEGYQNPARFTPFNEDVRREFKARQGVDPVDFYNPASPSHHLRDAAPMRRFLEYRAELAHRLQQQWLAEIERIRSAKPHLDLVLTHVDDRFDITMRDKLGADAARLLPDAAAHRATFLVEDPATMWHLGAERYAELSHRYARIAPSGAALAADINIVERYQDVYPTRQQTGSELFALVHAASRAFPRVALYFENSILEPDWPLLASAASRARVSREDGGALTVDSPESVAIAWTGCAQVDGAPWRAASAGRLLLTAGKHRVEPCATEQTPLLDDFNGELRGVALAGGRLRIDYESRARAVAILHGGRVVVLPPGRRSEWIN